MPQAPLCKGLQVGLLGRCNTHRALYIVLATRPHCRAPAEPRPEERSSWDAAILLPPLPVLAQVNHPALHTCQLSPQGPGAKPEDSTEVRSACLQDTPLVY